MSASSDELALDGGDASSAEAAQPPPQPRPRPHSRRMRDGALTIFLVLSTSAGLWTTFYPPDAVDAACNVVGVVVGTWVKTPIDEATRHSQNELYRHAARTSKGSLRGSG